MSATGLAQRDVERIARRTAELLQGCEQRSFYTPQTLTARLSISLRTVRSMLASGAIPSYRVEGARRIHPDDVEHYLRARREERTL